jgi:hypothetical protein
MANGQGVNWGAVKLAPGALNTGVDPRTNAEKYPAPKVAPVQAPTVDDVKFRITELHRSAQQSTVAAATMLARLGTFGITDPRVIAAARRELWITTVQRGGAWIWLFPS